MLKVKIESISGFGKTAEFAMVGLQHYDLHSGSASASVNLYEADPAPGVPIAMPTSQIMNKQVYCTKEELATWGTDDMVFVDLVLSKAGFVRDADWVAPEPAPAPAAAPAPSAPAEPTTTEEGQGE